MSTILLSIKPEYSNRIFNGTKNMSFANISQKNVDKIIVYSSSPEQQIIGEVTVTETLSLKPSLLWELTKRRRAFPERNSEHILKGAKMPTHINLVNSKI